MSFNKEQQQAIDCNSNCVVSAGAGSGKTEVLTTRFMRLVDEHRAHCDEILTITFTRKATSEMRARIHEKLMNSGNTEELKKFPFASISTVDSFCTSIVRSDCMRYGFTSSFSMLDTDDFENTALKLARKMLSETLNQPVTRRLVGKMGADNAASMFASLATDIFNVTQTVNPRKNSETVIEFAKEKLSDAKSTFTEISALLLDTLRDDPKAEKNVKSLNILNDAFEKGIYVIPKDVKLNLVNVSKDNKEIISGNKAKLETAINDCFVYSNILENRQFISDLYVMVAYYEQEILKTKRQMNAMLFEDVIKCAIDILTKNKPLRNAFKKKYRYIMIDEFQDNNDSYRQLLYLLAEREDKECDGIPDYSDLSPEKIFLVGDEKQSIYRFRGADVSVFKKLCSEIGQKIELKTNYRSRKELVEGFNTMFATIMGTGGERYEAEFRSLGANEDESGNGVKGKIVFHNFLRTDSDETEKEDMATSVQSEAKSLADLIYRMMNSDDFLIVKNGKTVRPKESDIAILLKTSGHQSDYEKALRLRKIRYTTAEAKGLTNEAVFCDFYTVLQLCIYPYDRISWVAFFKSPFCRLTDKEIAKINLADVPSEYLDMINNVREKLKATNLPETLDYIYNDMGYRTFLITNPANQVYCEHYDYLYALACNFEQSGKTVTEFLDYIRKLLGQASKIKDITVYGEDTEGVNIMTIHKSKGLGFPIVIVAGMESSKRAQERGYSTQRDGENVFVNCADTADGKFVNVFTYSMKDLEKRMETAELKRLFYVAATRAKYHLIFSATVTPSAVKEDSKTVSMLKMLLDSTEFDFGTQKASRIQMEGIPFALVPVGETLSKTKLRKDNLINGEKFYVNCQTPVFNWEKETVAVTEYSKSSEESVQKGIMLSSMQSDGIILEYGVSTDFGTLTHSFIEHRIKKSADKPVLKTDVLTEAEKNILISDAETLCLSFFNSEMYKKIQDYELHSEREFLLSDDGVIFNGVIDLLAVSDNEIYIIDFKTDRYRNPEEYENQLMYYRKAAESFYKGRDIHCILVYLRDADNPVCFC